LPKIILIAFLAAAIYFAAREILIRLILTLPQLAIIISALAVLLFLLPRYGGTLFGLAQRFLPQPLSLIFYYKPENPILKLFNGKL
jgi:hypothetical protein